MSSDNFFLVRRDDDQFVALMGFESDVDLPRVDDDHERFYTLQDAVNYAESQYSEYGVTIHPECFEDEPWGDEDDLDDDIVAAVSDWVDDYDEDDI